MDYLIASRIVKFSLLISIRYLHNYMKEINFHLCEGFQTNDYEIKLDLSNLENIISL